MNESQNEPGSDLAHPGKRYQGQFIDGLISLGLFAIGIYIRNTFELKDKYSGIIIIVVPFLYYLLSDALPKGQSIGKKLLNISVVHENTGAYCTVTQSIIRNILTPILGAFEAVFIVLKRRQRLGDMLAKTIVINNKS
jgi:uncharacterized RDD family membrane protein YckC